MAANLLSRRHLIGSLPAALLLAAAAVAADPANSLPVGRWLAEEIDGHDVDDVVRSILVIDADGQASGTGGCNTFHGSVRIEGDRIRFFTRSLVTTLKACEPDFSKQDRKFHGALELTRSFSLRPQERTLILLSRQDKPLMRLVLM